MADPGQSDGMSLDAQLRNMILGNVQLNQTSQQHRGRGRGRGFHRGGHGGHPSQDFSDRAPPAAGAAGGRGGRGHRGDRGYHSGHPWRGGRGGFVDSDHAQTSHHPRARGPHRGGPGRGRGMHPHQGQRQVRPTPEEVTEQIRYLEQLVGTHAPQFEMSPKEFEVKDHFRMFLQDLLQQAVIQTYPEQPPVVSLHIFGSLGSGFAMPGSDMDLALQSSFDCPGIFRVFQRTLLDRGIGARLLTRTRVPILKICSNPPNELMDALLEDRAAWDEMTPEEQVMHDTTGSRPGKAQKDEEKQAKGTEGADDTLTQLTEQLSITDHTQPDATPSATDNVPDTKAAPAKSQKSRPRDRKRAGGPLDFPPGDIGIECDINYANPLGLANTHLLRCYSACDLRVRLMILFVKGWASRRQINSSYSGTLSSYGYVLMVLHYLVNVVEPPLCPNLQLKAAPIGSDPEPKDLCQGCDVRFYDDEQHLASLAAQGALTHNREPLGSLLRGFFAFYAQQGGHVPKGGFSWTQQVLSLRHPNGVIWKADKGWTGAKTVDVDGKEVRNRYLFAIEDPFEIEHNVARTVTHHGIVAIRDEFRRAHRIICDAGRRQVGEDLMETLDDEVDEEPGPAEKPVAPGETGSAVQSAA